MNESNLVWDPRLITPDRVFAEIADMDVRFELRHLILDEKTADLVNGGKNATLPGMDPEQVTDSYPAIVCGRCRQPIAHDQADEDEPTFFTITELAVAVLRHRASAHEVDLSGNSAHA